MMGRAHASDEHGSRLVYQSMSGETMMHDPEQAIRRAAYFIWEREGRPKNRAEEHWYRATVEITGGSCEQPMGDEEKIMADRPDANWPALLTRDVLGG